MNEYFLDGLRDGAHAVSWTLGAATPIAAATTLLTITWTGLRRPLDRLQTRTRIALARRRTPTH